MANPSPLCPPPIHPPDKHRTRLFLSPPPSFHLTSLCAWPLPVQSVLFIPSPLRLAIVFLRVLRLWIKKPHENPAASAVCCRISRGGSVLAGSRLAIALHALLILERGISVALLAVGFVVPAFLLVICLFLHEFGWYLMLWAVAEMVSPVSWDFVLVRLRRT